MAYGIGENIFTAMIDEDGTIYEASTGRKRQAVGIDTQKEQELLKQIVDMQGIIDNYYAKLVELGAIVPPKTPEEIAQEQAAEQMKINQALMESIQNSNQMIVELQSQIKGLIRDGSDRYGARSGGDADEFDSEGVEQITRTGSGGNKSRKAASPRAAE